MNAYAPPDAREFRATIAVKIAVDDFTAVARDCEPGKASLTLSGTYAWPMVPAI